MKKNKLFLGIVALIFIVSSIIYALSDNTKPAPDFSLANLHGQIVTEQNLQGKVTFINFWYPSCPGCVEEMPKLIQLQKDLANNNFQILAIALNQNTEEQVRQFTKQMGLNFTVMYDVNGQVSNHYQVSLAPTSFLVDKKGRIVHTYLGSPDNWDSLKQRILQLLSQ